MLKNILKRTAALAMAAMLSLPLLSFAAMADEEEKIAKNITDECNVVTEGFYNAPVVLDKDRISFTNAYNGAKITASNIDGIFGFYMISETAAPTYTIKDTDNNISVQGGESGYIHDFIDLNSLFGYAPKNIEIDLPFHIAVDEIEFYSEGTPPSDVQVWNSTLEECDIMLLSSHADDEQLFFAGILPYYAKALGLKVQVVYFTNHNDVYDRRHELLDGLWTVGVTSYPIIGEFPDLYSENEEQARVAYANQGFGEKEFVSFITEAICRTKPLVVITHDIDGEYSHGTHIIAAKSAIIAINEAANERSEYEAVKEYGPWQIKKLYLHLYNENKITLDWDIPLTALNGKTAFEVTKEGFACHRSQHWTWFYNWIHGTADEPIEKASDIVNYSPCEYGLYFSSVGLDKIGGDFLENIVTYEEAEEIAEKEREEEESRKESESISESIRLEEESKKAEESRKEEESKKANETKKPDVSSNDTSDKSTAKTEETSKRPSQSTQEGEDEESDGVSDIAVIVLIAVAVAVAGALIALQFANDRRY